MKGAPVHFLETRPAPDEFVPYYAAYIARVPAGNLVDTLAAQQLATQRLLTPLDDARALHRYAAGKWSVKEVMGHVVDVERVFSYRALRFARADATPLAGFDERAYVPAAGFDRHPLAVLLEEFGAVRSATGALFASFDGVALGR